MWLVADELPFRFLFFLVGASLQTGVKVHLVIVTDPMEPSLRRLRVSFDREGNTLSVWFDDPGKEYICEEAGDDVVLIKDRRGRVIGFERLNNLSARQRLEGGSIPVEVQVV